MLWFNEFCGQENSLGGGGGGGYQLMVAYEV